MMDPASDCFRKEEIYVLNKYISLCESMLVGKEQAQL